MVQLKPIRKRVSASESIDVPKHSAVSAPSTESSESLRPIRNLNRVTPKTGVRADQRRRRLNKLRKSDRFTDADFEPKINHSTASGISPPTAKSKCSHKVERKDDGLGESDVAGHYRVFETVEPEPECYSDWFRRVVVRTRWMTWFSAFYMHWMMLLIMAAVIVHGPENTANLLLNATFAAPDDSDPEPFEIVIPEPQPQAQPQSAEPLIAEQNESLLTELSPDLDPAILDELSPLDAAAEKSQTTSESRPSAVPSDRTDSALPLFTPAHAVSEGSFSVWTEPSQPIAGQPYRIIIQVRLSPEIRQYDIADLEGVVVGSDGYRKPIPGTLRGSLPIDNGYARFVVPIVSADQRVCDTVFIRSRLLKESQKIVLQF